MTVSSSASPAARPMYRVPLVALAGFALSLILGRSRSFSRDAFRVLEANAGVPRSIEGIEHIPLSGAFVLVMNHYSRRGLRPYHCAMVVSSTVSQRRPGLPEIRWTFTSEYLGRHIGPIPVPLPLIRWVFRRVALVYSFIIMPRREELRLGRAAALRVLLRALDESPVGMAPEGLQSRGQLIEPPQGVGLFLAMAAHRAPVLPVGIWEDDGSVLHVRFGPCFKPDVPRPPDSRGEQDRRVSRLVMTELGRLLPPEYWGMYADDLRAAAASPNTVDGEGQGE